jgi:hypothetical protein
MASSQPWHQRHYFLEKQSRSRAGFHTNLEDGIESRRRRRRSQGEIRCVVLSILLLSISHWSAAASAIPPRDGRLSRCELRVWTVVGDSGKKREETGE